MKNILYFLLFYLICFKSLSQAGDYSTAYGINCDRLYPFSDGVARVQKGNAWKLIDKNGDSVVKFLQRYIIETDSHAHIIKVKDAYLNEFLLNPLGVCIDIIPKGYTASLPDKDGYIIVSGGEKPYFFKSGALKIPIEIKSLDLFKSDQWSENLLPFYDQGKKKYGFVDRYDHVVVLPKYDYAGQFSDGYALVGTKDLYGRIEYGFIDHTYAEKIKPQFTIKPGNFHNGFCLIEYKDKKDYNYGYIDENGNIPKTLNLKIAPNYKQFERIESDYGMIYQKKALWQVDKEIYFIDQTLPPQTLQQFLADFNLPNSYDKVIPNFTSSDVLEFSNGSNKGFLIFGTPKSFIPAIFLKDYSTFKYDSESKLILVSMKDTNNPSKTITGYINLKGVFVFIQVGDQF